MSSHTHGYQQRTGILLAVWQDCVMGKAGSGGNWKCFLCFVNRILMFALFGNLECQEESQHLKAGKRHRTEKGILKSQFFWRTLPKEKLWNVGYLWVDEAWIVLHLAEQYQCPGARQQTIFSPLLVEQSYSSWGRKLEWTVMAAQQGSYAFPQFSTGINLRAVIQCLMLSWKKKK